MSAFGGIADMARAGRNVRFLTQNGAQAVGQPRGICSLQNFSRSTVRIFTGTRCFFSEGHWPIVRSHMLIWHNVSVCSAVGLALCLASPSEAAKKHRKPTAAYHSMVHRQAAVAPRSAFQGGVLARPLY